jgi:phytoene synthase
MSLDACAALVERGDPDRFAALMAAPMAARPKLLPLYAFNLELARAPWVTAEPMIAEMRLQWWRDVVAGAAPRAHEVAAPLHALITGANLPVPVLDRLVAARVWDVYPDPFEDEVALRGYLDDTAGGLMWLSALALGAQAGAESVVRDFAFGAGLANYLRAVPVLEERGRRPLVDGRPAAVRRLASEGLAALARARAKRSVVAAAWPALLPGWQAAPLLAQVVRKPNLVADGTMGLSEFSRRGRLLWQAATRRW